MENRPEVSRVWGLPMQWSLVLGAAGKDVAADRDEAWNRLIERYREPVIRSIARRLPRGWSAEDAAQDFFTYLFENEVLGKIDPGAGRFRCYVQGVLHRYLKSYLRSASQRGESMPEEFDAPSLASAAALDVDDEREWASRFLADATERLLQKHPRDGRLLLETYGVPPFARTSSEEQCRRENIEPNALYVALHRARKRLRELLDEEIRATVATKRDFDDEVRVIVNRLLEAHPRLLDAAGAE